MFFIFDTFGGTSSKRDLVCTFFSGGGYCSEAISFAIGLYKAGVDIKIVQHGDSFNQKFVEGLPSEERLMLRDMIGNQVDPKESVVISSFRTWSLEPINLESH